MRPKLLLSFSGGKTSAYMTNRVLSMYSDKYEIITVFANTGQEREETLEFVNKCDKEFGFNTVWIEAVIDPELGKGTRHKIVTFETADRSGKAFEDMIKKYGIPNMSYPHCTRELKLQAIRSYMKSIGWDDYSTAIGIRPDEDRRVSDKADEFGIVYPLIDWFYADKQDVNDWWEYQSFNLELKEYQGNCAWCFKKSDKKHFKLIAESPEIFDFPKKMDELYGFSGNGSDIKDKGKRVFFRGHRSTEDLFKYAEYVSFEEGRQGGFDLDQDSGCSESCEVY